MNTLISEKIIGHLDLTKKVSDVPLYVDLDGTLIKSDLLLESLLILAKQRPLLLFLIPIWLLGGKAHLKDRIAAHVEIDASLLPYNNSFLEFLRIERSNGRRLVLATANHNKFAEAIAEHLGIFCGVIASDATHNLKGQMKLQRIHAECGSEGFDYAGNDRPDLAIWSAARKAILVNPLAGIERKVRCKAAVTRVFLERELSIKVYAKAVRLHQWLKNLLIFVPVFVAHEWLNLTKVIGASLAFIAFDLTASAMYILNDLLDLPSDRSHPSKRNRPFAAGDIPVVNGLVLMVLLLGAGIGLATWLSLPFLQVLLAYLALTLAYSFVLKAQLFVDVLSLASLYTVRVIAGAVVTAITPSFWLLAFSMFIFLSLALVKRCSELQTLAKLERTTAKGRDYRVSDLMMLYDMGICSGYLSVLVVALFINSPDVKIHYSHPQYLWLICPALLFWISRIWLKTRRDEMHDDPVIFAIKDRLSPVLALLIVLIVASAL